MVSFLECLSSFIYLLIFQFYTFLFVSGAGQAASSLEMISSSDTRILLNNLLQDVLGVV